jgi:hypothetical protein
MSLFFCVIQNTEKVKSNVKNCLYEKDMTKLTVCLKILAAYGCMTEAMNLNMYVYKKNN